MIQKQAFHVNLLRGIFDTVHVWAQGRPIRLIKLYKRYKHFQNASRIRNDLKIQDNIQVPPVLILSVTMKCNLECMGCYSRDYDRKDELSLQEIDQLFTDAKSSGVAFFVLTGGEPLMKKGLMELCFSHPELLFLLFTNGTQIDDDMAKLIAKNDNVIPIVSVEGKKEVTDERRGEGVHERVIEAMSYLKRHKALFGYSSVVTKKNNSVIGTDNYIDEFMNHGARIGFYLGYVPCDEENNDAMLASVEEQDTFRNQLEEIKSRKRMIFVHLPDDEFKLSGSCMAAGGGFLHINAQGNVEPCPFAHLAADNIRQKSLKEVFASPFFSRIREHRELLEKPHMGCALYQNRDRLCEVVSDLDVKATDSHWEKHMVKGVET